MLVVIGCVGDGSVDRRSLYRRRTLAVVVVVVVVVAAEVEARVRVYIRLA